MLEPEDFYAHLKSLGFEPRTIIDVGVAWGTPPLYEAFPDAYLILFEALPMFEKSIAAIVGKRAGEYHLVGLSNHEGEATIHVGRSSIQQAGASLHHREGSSDKDAVVVRISRLDSALSGRALARPLLLKIDAQGSDIEVLAGARKTLIKCDVVVVEAGMFPFANDRNQLHHIMAFMAECGFRPYDLISLRRRPNDNALGQLDVAFVKDRSIFRHHSQWA